MDVTVLMIMYWKMESALILPCALVSFYKFLDINEFNYECYPHENFQVVGRLLQYCKVVLSLSQARL